MKVAPGESSKYFLLKSFCWSRGSGERRVLFTPWFKSHQNTHVRPCQKNGLSFVHILAGTSTPLPPVAATRLPSQPCAHVPRPRLGLATPLLEESCPVRTGHRRASLWTAPGACRGLSSSPMLWHSLDKCGGQGSAAHFLRDIWAENPQNNNRSIHLN